MLARSGGMSQVSLPHALALPLAAGGGQSLHTHPSPFSHGASAPMRTFVYTPRSTPPPAAHVSVPIRPRPVALKAGTVAFFSLLFLAP
jgi:hypothetical protein